MSSLIYAVGDIHGCHDKLRAAVAKIRAHAGANPYRVIFLGDYVDRGPDSRGVVDLVKDLVTDTSTQGVWRALKGNHEQMMIAAERGEDLALWFGNGGAETLASYAGYGSEMRQHAAWLDSLPAIIETENHIFVHAGLSPRHSLAGQPEEVLLWTRGWQKRDRDFGKHVVYGHQAAEGLELRRFSTGLDTGACYGGPLTVGVFDAAMNGGPADIIEAR
ncbi:MAG TPA: metallophosphoesterase family protein [Rhizomicrobium sp.]|jgi:serine/threonine protein phosphatase 1|nr:metallophosphoesterase family protein [Rhizomicrobium sp.]